MRPWSPPARRVCRSGSTLRRSGGDTGCVELDFSRFGRSATIEARLFPDERDGLSTGDTVLLSDDTVDPQPFEVVSISDDGRDFTFRRL